MAAGLAVALVLALAQAWCVDIHEKLLGLSVLMEVEREISFRTECGLYYSYYKQMLQAPSIGQVWLMFVTTVCFCLTWQFNQFILLLQTLALFSLDAVDIIPARQVRLPLLLSS
ncbi:hypothetical protein NHX12_005256 [Muraenolepis orangiensis]|uniref:Uncharacterized protein n=1 Tax=Muraenolepis orangiensis TaxID=630683 RepID=A0A9Q0ICT0_9TELE|nr:hypothetical protein NHX12_005256 [Muraenolepis orangiensis]